MSLPKRVIVNAPLLRVPGLEHRPDLAKRMERELAGKGCTGCAKAALARKYQALARQQ